MIQEVSFCRVPARLLQLEAKLCVSVTTIRCREQCKISHTSCSRATCQLICSKLLCSAAQKLLCSAAQKFICSKEQKFIYSKEQKLICCATQKLICSAAPNLYSTVHLLHCHCHPLLLYVLPYSHSYN